MTMVQPKAPVQFAHGSAERPLKFVFFPMGWVLAHVGRSCEIAKVLRARGHEVVFAGEDPDHPMSRLDHVIKQGFRWTHVKEVAWHWAWARFEKYGAACAVYDFFRHNRWAPIEEIVTDIIRVVKEEEPDLILGDSCIGASTAGYATDTPAAGVLNGYNSHFFRDGCFTRHLINVMNEVKWEPVRNRIYKRHGKPPCNAIELLKQIPMLSPDLEEFHKPHGDYPNWLSIGPLLSEPPAPLPDWFDELKDGTPNIYITMGSTGLPEPLLTRCYDALGKTDYRFVVTTGNQMRQEAMDAAPGNFRFVNYAPGTKILEYCKAEVNHGGNGTMYQALAAGVPVISLPSHLEQGISVDVMLKEGIGLRRSARRTTGEELVKAIDEVVNDPSYKLNAWRFREKVRHANAAEKAADILEKHARSGSLRWAATA